MPSRPSLRFLLAHPAHLMACGFGSGLSPWAPGSAGTLFAWLTFPMLRGSLGDLEFFGLLVVSLVAGVAAANRTGADLGVVDHGSIVWDEIVAFWLVLFLCPGQLLWQAVAFALFRFFDVVKPEPIRHFDEKMKNGLGVMFDDLIAAGYTLLVLALLGFVLR